MDFDGQVKSDGHHLHSEGKAKAADLRVVKGGQPQNSPLPSITNPITPSTLIPAQLTPTSIPATA